MEVCFTKEKWASVEVGEAHLILRLHDKLLSLYFVLTYRALFGLSFLLLKDPPSSGYYVNEELLRECFF